LTQAIEFFIPAVDSPTGDALRDYATRRLSFALRRFEHCVRRITVRFVDLNGPRRGLDSRCSMTLDLVGGRRILVEATTARPFASIALAATRLNAVVRKEVARAASHRRHHEQPDPERPDGQADDLAEAAWRQSE
jgi:putative sigma-54 modulation protein